MSTYVRIGHCSTTQINRSMQLSCTPQLGIFHCSRLSSLSTLQKCELNRTQAMQLHSQLLQYYVATTSSSQGVASQVASDVLTYSELFASVLECFVYVVLYYKRVGCITWLATVDGYMKCSCLLSSSQLASQQGTSRVLVRDSSQLATYWSMY